ncbi:hypothetical protein [Sinobaca sp. H24]|uniref:hypothetical protein n=1 Tax=Sinobaca sp. H24 TaxID=2923376 RepID=UPI00207949D5|nr:hypothetical protein [Sinobaca sp. H24]
MMEKQFEVMNHTLLISETLVDSLVHVQWQLNQQKYQDAVFLIEDALKGFASLERALLPLISNSLEIKETDMKLPQIRKSIDYLVASLEKSQFGKVQEVLHFSLLPQVKAMKTACEKYFHPYVLS